MENRDSSPMLPEYSTSSSLESLLLELATTTFGAGSTSETSHFASTPAPTDASMSVATPLINPLPMQENAHLSEHPAQMTEDESITALLLSTLKLVAESPLPSISTVDPDPGFSSTTSSSSSNSGLLDSESLAIKQGLYSSKSFIQTLQDAYWNGTLCSTGLSGSGGQWLAPRNSEQNDMFDSKFSIFSPYDGSLSHTSPPGCFSHEEGSDWRNTTRRSLFNTGQDEQDWLPNYATALDALGLALSKEEKPLLELSNFSENCQPCAAVKNDNPDTYHDRTHNVNPSHDIDLLLAGAIQTSNNPTFNSDEEKVARESHYTSREATGKQALSLVPDGNWTSKPHPGATVGATTAPELKQQLPLLAPQTKTKQQVELKSNRPKTGPTYWGMWEDERSRMVYVSWLPRAARAGDRMEKKRCEVELKYFISRVLGFSGLLKVLLFPPSSAHCKLLFTNEVAARRFLEAFGTMQSENGAALWKSLVCQHFCVNIRDGIHATRVKIIWADQTKTDAEILAKTSGVHLPQQKEILETFLNRRLAEFPA